MHMSQAAFALELSQVVNRVFLVRSEHAGTVRTSSTCGKAERSGLSWPVGAHFVALFASDDAALSKGNRFSCVQLVGLLGVPSSPIRQRTGVSSTRKSWR